MMVDGLSAPSRSQLKKVLTPDAEEELEEVEEPGMRFGT